MPFFTKRSELSLFDGCILWGTRASVCRETILVELHCMNCTRDTPELFGLSRSYVWWPGITSDIETVVHLCTECQMSVKCLKQPRLLPRCSLGVDLDYAGPVHGKMYLVLIDAHSKWIEAFCTPSATSSAVIEELRPLFAQFGLPETIVTDNGTCFVSVETLPQHPTARPPMDSPRERCKLWKEDWRKPRKEVRFLYADSSNHHRSRTTQCC